MKRLEEELRAALKREDPPLGFAERVLARAAAQAHQRERTRWARFRDAFAIHRLQWAAAAVVLAVIAGGVGLRIEQDRRAEGEAAKRQVMLALHIASAKWQVAAREINGQSNARTATPHDETENHE
ncbi:MAG TPA: hypothetical protein VKW78_23475 [Terriglobales bacterium]|nr:hypothetical protein [Terriglobales bacterium]